MKDKRGRPKKIIAIDEIYKAARFLPTQSEMAAFFGCSRSHMEKILAIPEYREAYEEGMEKGKLMIRQTQLEVGINRKNPTMLMYLGKQYLGQRDRIETETKITVDTLPSEERAKRLADLLTKAIGIQARVINNEPTESIPGSDNESS